DVTGQLRHVDLRNLPRDLKIPAADTNVSGDYHVAGSVTTGKNPTQNIKGDVKFLPSTLAGATIAGGSTAGFTMNGKAIGYSADATVQNLDLQRVVREFNVAPLADDKYKSTINAHLVANGSGTTPKEMNLTARGSFTDTTLMGGTIPQLDFDTPLSGVTLTQLDCDATLANDTAHV